MIFAVIGAVVLLLVLLLQIADRHDERHGHRPRRMGDIRSASRTKRRDLRTARSARYLPHAIREDPRRQRREKRSND